MAEDVLTIIVLLYTVSNVMTLGLEAQLGVARMNLRKPGMISLILLWGWIVGPLVAMTIIWLIPLSPGHAAGLLLISLAPAAPFYPIFVRKANADMAFAAAFMLVASIGTVLLLPMLAPILIGDLDLGAWALAKPLIVMVLLPLLAGSALRFYQPDLSETLLPFVKRTGDVSLILCMLSIVWFYRTDLVSAIGSFAPGSILLFLIAITVVSFRLSFGLDYKERSGMALGMCSRNLAPVFAAYFGIPDPPEGLLAVIILSAPLALIVTGLAARIFSWTAATN